MVYTAFDPVIEGRSLSTPPPATASPTSMPVDSQTHPVSDYRAAFYSALLPGLGHVLRGRHNAAMFYGLITIFLIVLSVSLGRLSGRAAEVFFFMLLALPWWALQSYDASLGPAASGSDLVRTSRRAWAEGHDIRFLGLLFLISAANDAIIIAKNPEYLLPFFCTKLDGAAGFVTKALSPLLHTWVGYGFLRVKKWALLVYLIYAAYGIMNALVNLTCFGPGRIRNTLLIALIAFTAYIFWRRRMFQR